MKTIKMKRADWEKWDKALRSGAYVQGPDYLHHNGAYCCLGVLQHCLSGATEEGPDYQLPSLRWLRKYGITFYNPPYTVSPNRPDCAPYLPSLVMAANTANDRLRNDGTQSHGYNFEQIADAIAACVEFTDEAT